MGKPDRDACRECKARPWRVAIYAYQVEPWFLCKPCLIGSLDGLPEAQLYALRVTDSQRLYFGGLVPLVEWLIDGALTEHAQEEMREVLAGLQPPTMPDPPMKPL